MSIDSLIGESLKDKAAEYMCSEYNYEAVLANVEKTMEKQRRKAVPGFLDKVGKIVTGFHIKDILEIAAVILVLIAVPVMVSHFKGVSQKSGAGIATSEATKEPARTKAAIDAKTVDLQQAIKDGTVVMVVDTDKDNSVENKVYNTEKLDKFVENTKNGVKDSIRIIIFKTSKSDISADTIKDLNNNGSSNARADTIKDLNYDGSRIEAIYYALQANKILYKANDPLYFTRIGRTEEDNQVSYTLFEKAEDTRGIPAFSYSKAVENNSSQNNTDDKQYSEDLKLSPDAVLNYLKQNNYDIRPTGVAQAIITLPESYSTVKNGKKIGEMLKDRNERSKNETNLDFSKYLGSQVLVLTAAVTKNGSAEKFIVVLALGNRIIGVWTDAGIGGDYNFLNENLSVVISSCTKVTTDKAPAKTTDSTSAGNTGTSTAAPATKSEAVFKFNQILTDAINSYPYASIDAYGITKNVNTFVNLLTEVAVGVISVDDAQKQLLGMQNWEDTYNMGPTTAKYSITKVGIQKYSTKTTDPKTIYNELVSAGQLMEWGQFTYRYAQSYADGTNAIFSISIEMTKTAGQN
ncbi:MAG: hypothetical protein Q8930_11935 [Bacillota bacterium]|nr:hypothetical protein [Bacillota bacterium]